MSSIKRIRRLALLLMASALWMASGSPALWAAGQWLPGDMHSHISPPDVPPDYKHAKNDLEGAIAAARQAGLKWVVITPHAMDRQDEKTGRLWAVEMEARLAKRETRSGDPLVVLGWEMTMRWPGHMTVSFVDLAKVAPLPLEKVLEATAAARGLAIVAHPFQLPGLLTPYDASWRPWTAGPKGQEFDPWLSGLEVRHPASPAASACEHWDEWISRQRRRIIGVGATDDHWGLLYATTWVCIDGDLTRQKLHQALLGGRIVVGSEPSAGSLTATSDHKDDSGKPLARGVGDDLAADEAVELNWTGKARLFVDGALQQADEGPFKHRFAKGTFHWYRLEAGIKSYGNPVYVNLPAAVKPKPLQASTPAPAEARDAEAEKSPPAYGKDRPAPPKDK